MTEQSTMAAIEQNPEVPLPPPSTEKMARQHRPDIDIIRICLTLEVIIYHCIMPYLPTGFFVTHPEIVTFPGYKMGLVFLFFMNYWHMAAFFFLAGVSAYLSLGRRTEQQYRDERVHRLITPTLFLLAFTNLLYLTAYWAPLSEGCIQHHFKGNTSAVCQSWLWKGENDTLGTLAVRVFSNKMYIPTVSQAWFCVYLFVYSQLLGSLFLSWHPEHEHKSSQLAWMVSGCIKKPYMKMKEVFSGHKFKKTQEEVISTDRPWAASPIKLLFYPGIILAISECTLWQVSIVRLQNLFSVFYEFPATVTYIMVYIAGYLVTAHDNAGAKEAIHGLRYWSLTIGMVLLSGCVALRFNTLNICDDSNVCHTSVEVLHGVLSGQGKWMLILGLYGVARSRLKTNYSWLPTLRKMAMPVYLIHLQILVAILSVTLWVPYLRSFPAVLSLTTLASCLVAYLITKSGSFMYFFGLPPPKGSWLPGKTLRGFVPMFVLAGIVLVETVLAGVLKIVWEVYNK